MSAVVPLSTAVSSTVAPATADLPASSSRTLQVEAWPDPVIDALGHDPRSLYVELFWLSILGPSTTWLLRRLARQLDDEPDGFAFDCSAASVDLGLGGHAGKHSVLMRSVDRCCHFGMAQRHGPTLYVRRRLPPLSLRQVEKLPVDLRTQHEAWDRRPLDGRSPLTPEPPIDRARQLALTLLQLGEEPDAIERQLHRWHFHPSLAWNATQWAQTQPSPPPTPPDKTP